MSEDGAPGASSGASRRMTAPATRSDEDSAVLGREIQGPTPGAWGCRGDRSKEPECQQRELGVGAGVHSGLGEGALDGFLACPHPHQDICPPGHSADGRRPATLFLLRSWAALTLPGPRGPVMPAVSGTLAWSKARSGAGSRGGCCLRPRGPLGHLGRRVCSHTAYFEKWGHQK